MEKKLKRTTGSEAMVLGICGGLAKYLAVDATLVRVVWAVATVFGIGAPILIYGIMAFIIPKEEPSI